jgi:large subunit ribosomal protein L10
MTQDKKVVVVSELTAKLAVTPHFYITDASGMTVAQVTKFRALCFKRGVEYKVVKNSLIKKALEANNIDYSSYKSSLKGFSGIIFSPEVAKLPAEIILEFKKANPTVQKPLLKVASVDSAVFIGNDQLEALSKLKSREELIGDIIGLLQSPAKNVISALQSSGGKLAGILKTLSEREG